MAKYKIEINKKWCKACGIGVEFCPKNVLDFGLEGKAAVVDLESCIGCNMCEYRCPDYAIKVEGSEINEAAS